MTEEHKYDEMVEPYLEGLLNEQQKKEFEEHLAQCESCREQLEMAQHIEMAMERLAERMEAIRVRVEEKTSGIDERIAQKMEKLDRQMEELDQELEAIAPQWLASRIMESVRAEAAAKPEPKRNWLLWLGCVLFGLGAVGLCVLVAISGVGGIISDTVVSVSPRVEQGILNNQTLLLGLALLPFGYGLFRVGQAFGYI